MKMNEEEAIERLNRYKTIKVLYGNTFAMHLEQLEQLKNDIDTVLNLLEKKDKVINEYEKETKTRSTPVNLINRVSFNAVNSQTKTLKVSEESF